MEIRELTRLEQLEWLKDTLERELIGILEELDECNKEIEKVKKLVKEGNNAGREVTKNN